MPRSIVLCSRLICNCILRSSLFTPWVNCAIETSYRPHLCPAMNDAGDHSAPSTHLVHNITFPVRPLPFLRPLYIPDNPRSFSLTLPQNSQVLLNSCLPITASSTPTTPYVLTYRTLQPHSTALAMRRAVNKLCIQFHGSLISPVATAQIQILALPRGGRCAGPASEARRRASSRAINIYFPYTVPKAPHRLQTRLRSYPFFVFQVAIKYDKDIDTFSIRRCTRPRHHQLSPTRQRTANTSTEVLDLQGTGCGLGTLPPIV
ncbi:hypothetical protein B0H14DRAFT_3169868 [Mycena olivaceomarginata]|nr:hypothetical protein B0H14DRAFT_3169868 [Mycena olivaceomarginata]